MIPHWQLWCVCPHITTLQQVKAVCMHHFMKYDEGLDMSFFASALFFIQWSLSSLCLPVLNHWKWLFLMFCQRTEYVFALQSHLSSKHFISVLLATLPKFSPGRSREARLEPQQAEWDTSGSYLVSVLSALVNVSPLSCIFPWKITDR